VSGGLALAEVGNGVGGTVDGIVWGTVVGCESVATSGTGVKVTGTGVFVKVAVSAVMEASAVAACCWRRCEFTTRMMKTIIAATAINIGKALVAKIGSCEAGIGISTALNILVSMAFTFAASRRR
jgi:hypothetical protein